MVVFSVMVKLYIHSYIFMIDMWYNSLPFRYNEELVRYLLEYGLLHVLSALTISRLTRVAGGPDQTSSRQTVYTERAVT